ncbi:shikimate kinase [Rhabdobacter roseus]|uniref:Shikimate kinase n=1 Tax=Rhabdobacter roseus TaxID=1655419 RepID=A0A840TJA7_9BACT|nr:shikimate kinase [Rhabdobacter roseus]MBB5283524.1 shikimate kinase [Rhabdobacter roseus]
MKNIFLVGMPSSGKSTLGKKLARRLGYRFVDLDEYIVRDQKRSITDIFSQDGEGYFREVESRVLKTIVPNRALVVATGGGAPCFFDNMDYIKASGLSVFLDVPPAALARRIQSHGQDDRPLLSGATALEKELTRKYLLRRPYYSRADLILSGEMNVEQLVEQLKPLL